MRNRDDMLKQVQDLFNANDYYGAEQLLLQWRATPEVTNSDFAYASHLLGRIHFYSNNMAKAKRFFLDAVERDSRDSYSRIYLARILENGSDSASAMKLYAEAMYDTPPFIYLRDRFKQHFAEAEWNDPELEKVISLRQTTKKGIENIPKFSILVLCYNKASFTIRCLEALFKNTTYPNYEVIVVDNASVDETPAVLETFGSRIRFVHSSTNLGFVGGNNFAAAYASGDYIVFLNNDTEPQMGWLTELYNMFQRDAHVGAVGSMLVYPNGVLQEAGGVIFSDATGWNYGRNSGANSSLFRFAREVDYCSGAALAVRGDLFRKLSGFDQRFAPAYWEDTDLCFGIRKLGFKVMYCPTSKVVHHEGITSGTDLNSGFKKFQVTNTPKFKEKWGKELARQYPPDTKLRYQFSNRKCGKRILIIDDLPPLPDRAAGSLRLYHTVRQMLALGYQVTYVHLTALGLDEAAVKHMDEYRAQGVEFIWFEYERWWELRNTPHAKPFVERLIASLELPFRKFDLAYICFWHIAAHFIDLIRKVVPQLPIVVDSMDIHFLREARQAEILKDAALRAQSKETKKLELETYAKADAVTTVTENDRDFLRAELPEKAVLIMTDVHDPVAPTRTFEQRKDFIFIGNFNHNPNEDAVLYFVKEIFPRIKQQATEARFLVVGNNPTNKIKELASSDVIVTGWVPEVRPYLENARVSVVPLRYGAGNKGKVGETLAYGVPMVSTSIGAEGMNIVHGEHAFVSNDPKEFAEFAAKMYADKQLWERFARQGKTLVVGQYSSTLMRKRVEYLTSFTTRQAFKSIRATQFSSPPKVSIIVLTHSQWTYTQQCLMSIRDFTSTSHETIVVDNASTDETAKKIAWHFPEVRLIENSRNAGFPIAVNQGINAALGEYVVLLNNDTVLTQGWLERLIEVAESDPSIGIVGPMSNYVSGPQMDKHASYKTIMQMQAYASKVNEERKGQTTPFPRVAFLCTLIKRKVIDTIGGLDERFSPGNFEDDDYCLRSILAGFKTCIANDVFVHHYGSKSFLAEGAEKYKERLAKNGRVFEEKWGVEHELLWTTDSQVRKRSLRVPINRDRFVQHFEQAQLHIEEQEMALAFTALRQAIQCYHESPRETTFVEFTDVLDLTAYVALSLGELETARQLLEEELRLTPTSAQACTGLGEVFTLAGLPDAARTMFEHAIEYDPQCRGAKEGLEKLNKLSLSDEQRLHNSQRPVSSEQPAEVLTNA